MDDTEKRNIALSRAEELKARITDYLDAKKNITVGINIDELINRRKEKIKKVLGATDKDWIDWKWQIKNRINDVEILGKIINLELKQKNEISAVQKTFAWSVSPYYCTLMDENNPDCPVRLMCIPGINELLDNAGLDDPMKEEFTNPAGSVTRRYPDRLIVNVTNNCGAYCRFCQRRRLIGEMPCSITRDNLNESVNYVRDNKEIRDILITGGDPFTLKDSEIEYILSGFRDIPHVEIIRIGTRTPVTLPMRITANLCRILKKYHPLYVNTHFNNPIEISKSSKEAAERLADAGIPLGNQMVLLNGINNDKHIVKCLNQELLKIRVKPYYIFHPKQVKGTAHFRCSIEDGLDIMEHLRGYTSGLAVPYYIVNAPGGLGKIPIMPQYLIKSSDDSYELRTWEGKTIIYDKK